jgi:DNA polymerase-3 subunit delta'
MHKVLACCRQNQGTKLGFFSFTDGCYVLWHTTFTLANSVHQSQAAGLPPATGPSEQFTRRAEPCERLRPAALEIFPKIGIRQETSSSFPADSVSSSRTCVKLKAVPLPSTFADFLGNTPTVENLRAAIATGRLPHSLILAGPRGAGKYTLALLLTMALECERQPRETVDNRELAAFCGLCRNCTRIAEAANLQTRIDEAVAVREEMRETDKKDTRVLVQTHPDVLIVPPDPPQLLIKLGQVRTMIQRSQYRPAEAPRKVFIVTSASFMKEAANSLLKLLEEPPDYAHLILLAENTGELLPTIRSRCAVARLGALPAEEIEALLASARPDWTAPQRALTARLAEGTVGRALAFDLAESFSARNDALIILRNAAQAGDHTALFKLTETYRAGAEGQVKTTALLRALGSVLEDLLLLQSGAADRARNVDILPELNRLAESFDFAWIEAAMRGLDGVQSGLRRNLLRSLSLDAFATALELAR